MSDAGDLLAASVKQFDETGWCTNELQDEKGQCCAIGILARVTTGRGYHFWSALEENPVVGQAVHALAAHVPSDFKVNSYWDSKDDEDQTRVVSYNNSRTDYQEIKDWFEKAALDEGVTL